MQLILLLTVIPAILVGRFFVQYDPGPAEPKRALEIAVGFGVLAVVLAIAISTLFAYVLGVDIESATPGLTITFIGPILLHASVEEFVKFIPLALYVYHRSYFNEHTDGIIYFSFVGLTFGAIESVLYAAADGEAGFIIALVRLALGFFFHAALTAYVGYYLARVKVGHKSIGSVVIALVIACIAHTLYNIGAFALSQYPAAIFISAAVAITMNVVMFWLYYRASELDIAMGFRPQPVLMPQPPITAQQLQVQQQVTVPQAQYNQNPPTIQPPVQK